MNTDTGPAAAPATGHYLALDGLRGVAALLVFASHAEGIWRHVRGPFSHAHLAVDFFFVLSGFVIGHAYEQKIERGTLNLCDFAWARWLRLYPLTFLGALIGLVSTLVHPIAAPVLIALAGQLTFWPLFSGDLPLYFLNPVQWSVLLEVLANGLHAVSLKWLSARVLAVLCLVGFAFLTFCKMRHQSFDAGFTANTFRRGCGRILCSYTAGVLLYRAVSSGRLPVIKVPFWALSLLLCGSIIGCAYAEQYQFSELLSVASFPLIVWAGIGTRLKGLEQKAAQWLGRSSYPLYAVHFPLLVLLTPIVPNARWMFPVVLFAGFLLALALDPADAWARRKLVVLRQTGRLAAAPSGIWGR